MIMSETEERLMKDLANKANELMSDWSSAKNKQREFVLNYLANGFSNATQAAINAGYSEKSAHKTASNMLAGGKKYVHISKVINELKNAFDEAKEELSIASATEVMQYWTKVLRGEITEYKVPPGGKGAIEVPASVGDRNKAGELLLKTSGEMKNRVEVEANVNNHYETLSDEELDELVKSYADYLEE